MQAIADHAYHILIILFVATTIVEVIVKAARKPRKKKRGPVAPRESAAEREKRLRVRYAAFGDRWGEWLDRPRGSGDADRLVTAASVWGSPEQGASFPRRFHDSQLGKVMLDKRSYLAMLNAPADVVQPRRELAPASWAKIRLDVWALHSKAAQKPRLMRVWLSGDRALVELHRTRVVKVDEILRSETVGFVRGFTRLGPRTGKVDGLRWLPAEAMELGRGPCGTRSASCAESLASRPRCRPSPMRCVRGTITRSRSWFAALRARGERPARICASWIVLASRIRWVTRSLRSVIVCGGLLPQRRVPLCRRRVMVSLRRLLDEAVAARASRVP